MYSSPLSFSRYSCFVCDFDLCLECKTVWEERHVARRAKAERRLRRNPRLNRAEVSKNNINDNNSPRKPLSDSCHMPAINH